MVGLSSWSLAGPYSAANSNTAFSTAWGPELAEPEEPVEWREDAALVFDPPRSTPQGGNSALYLRRTITVGRDTRMAVSLGSDDTLQVWLNGEELLAVVAGDVDARRRLRCVGGCLSAGRLRRS